MASRGQFNSKSPTIRRILREASELSTAPSADYTATPLDDNLFEWHFTLRGPPGGSSSGSGSTIVPRATSTTSTSNDKSKGPYNEGIYHGRIVLPPAYPLKPPSFRFLTPSGRFETNREICLSISGHHEETWQPAWGLRTALVALRTFMETDAKGQLGGLECSDDVRRRMAQESRGWKCPHCAKTNEEIIQETAAAAEEVAKSNNSVASISKTEEVPTELRMGWRDEMGKHDAQQSNDEDQDEEAHLAEGFVQTVPPATVAPAPMQPTDLRASPTTATTTAISGYTYPPARPGQSIPRPTGTASTGATTAFAQRRVQAINASDDGVPRWVDRAIAVVILSLVIMVLKLVYGL